MIGVLSNEYKKIITSGYAFIFTFMVELNGKYGYNLNKIPFVDKLQVYNSASNKIKFKNKNNNSGYDIPETFFLETFIERFRDSATSEVEEKTKKDTNKPLHFEEHHEGIFKTWEAKVDDNLKITIIEGKAGPFRPVYSVYAKRYDIENGDKRGYIEIASHKGSDLSEAKEIADKMKNIALKYTAPNAIKTNFEKKIPTSSDFKESEKYGLPAWEMEVGENCKLTIMKSPREKSHHVYIKMHEKERGMTNGYIELASYRGTTFSQAKIIAEKLYNIAISYKTPGI